MIKFLEVKIAGSEKKRMVNLQQITSYAKFENVSGRFTKVLLNNGQKLIVYDEYEAINDRINKLMGSDSQYVSKSTVEIEQKESSAVK